MSVPQWNEEFCKEYIEERIELCLDSKNLLQETIDSPPLSLLRGRAGRRSEMAYDERNAGSKQPLTRAKRGTRGRGRKMHGIQVNCQMAII